MNDDYREYDDYREEFAIYNLQNYIVRKSKL